MASSLDLQEQEQIDQLKDFWRRYGNAITWVLTLVLAGYAGWMGWQWWQREQGAKASGIYAELERAARAGDAERAGKVAADLRERYGSTTFASQGALLVAKVQADKGQLDAARANLAWVADQGADDAYRSVARLRLAGVLMDEKKYDEALKQLGGDMSAEFAPLAADRRGDILLAQGQRDQAVSAYQQAWDKMDATLDYRRLVEAKLMSLGAAPKPAAAAAGASAAGGQP